MTVGTNDLMLMALLTLCNDGRMNEMTRAVQEMDRDSLEITLVGAIGGYMACIDVLASRMGLGTEEFIQKMALIMTKMAESLNE